VECPYPSGTCTTLIPNVPSPTTAETTAAIGVEAGARWETTSALAVTKPRSLTANSSGTRWDRRDGGLCCSADARRAEDVGVGWRLEAPASGYRTPRDGCQLPGVKTLAGSCVTAPVWIRTSSIVMVARVVRFSTRRFADAAEGERFAPSSAPDPRVAAGTEPRAADVLSEIRSAKN
jgi:hypothetical protein